MESKTGQTDFRKRRSRGRAAIFAYLASIMLIMLVGMSIYELTKHFIFSHTGRWTMHVYDIASSVLIATIAGLIAFQKFRSLRKETVRERLLRKKLENQIDERIKTEKKLRQSEVRVRAIVDTAVDGIITINERAYIETFNRSAESIFGYRAEEVIGQNISMLMPTPYRQEHDDYVTNYLKTGTRKIIGIGREVEGTRKDGRTFPLDLSVSEFYVGSQRYFTGIVRDISERQQMETALREERNFINAVLSTAGALIIVMDRQGRIVRFNTACEKTTGFTYAEVKGQSVWDVLLLPEQAEAFKVLLKELQVGDFPSEFEYDCVTKKGSQRLISWKNTALLDKQGNVQDIIATGIDITEHRRAEEQAKKHQEELAHMDRLSAMGEMATGLAHELNQPLAAAYAYSKACLVMLGKGQEKSEKFINALEQMGKTTEQAGLIVRRLRNFIGKKETKKVEINLKERIDEIIKLTQAQSRNKDIRIENNIDEQLPRLFADPVQIDQVLLNLVRNSIEAMTNSEQRTITLLASSIDDSNVEIIVQDTGIGLEKDQAEQVFNAFHTTKPDGMGMGLAISRSIIETHGGKLWADVGNAGGAAFHFTLPVVRA